MSQPWSTTVDAPPPPPAVSIPPGPAPRPLPRWAPPAAALALALLFGVAGFFVGRSSAQPDLPSPAAQAAQQTEEASLKAAYDACLSQDDDDTLELADDGTTIVVDTHSEYGDPSGMNCVLDELGTPESIIASMQRTTAMMGVQEAEDDGISYSWSYHPDNGVNMVITRD